jgi:diphosphomevalonate decarboxylase
VVSRNTFPTAAGLASSAAGYACLVYALAKVLGVPTDKAGLSKLSVIARQGSGSACRSLFGGFVRWEQGTAAGGGEGAWSNSRAVQVASEEMWPELETLILVTNAAKKATGSTEGMERSVRTSPLLMHRATSGIVDERLSRIERAFKEKDFATFGELTMKDSNQVMVQRSPFFIFLSLITRSTF